MITRDEWKALSYPVRLRRLSGADGGGWLATIPALGEAGFVADAETPGEAVAALEEVRISLYDDVVASGQPIPDPNEDRAGASGRWLQRAPRRLHAELQFAAGREGVSFNTYCVDCLTRGHAMRSFAEELGRTSVGSVVVAGGPSTEEVIMTGSASKRRRSA